MELDQLKKQVRIFDLVPSPEGLKRVGHGVYQLDPCPVCGHLDHFTIYEETNSYSSFSDCCVGGSVIDYLMEVEHMTLEGAIKKLKDIAGVADEPHSVVSASPPLAPADKLAPSSLVEKATIHAQTCDFFRNRGLSDAIVKRYALGYLPDGWPGIGPDFKYVIPVTKSFTILRSDAVSGADRYRNLGKTEVLNAHYLSDPAISKIAITEGVIDALSLEDLGQPAISLNSTAKASAFLQLIESHGATAQLKNKIFLLCLDNDDAGKGVNRKIRKALKEMGIRSYTIDLSGHADVNDFFIHDRDALNKNLENIAVAGSVYEYLQKGFKNDQVGRSMEAELHTGIHQLDNCLGGSLYPGLYVLGAISSLGKTALALQVSDHIASTGFPVLFYSLEMARYEMVCRSLSRVMFELGDKDVTTGEILRTTYKCKDINENELFIEAKNKYGTSVAKNLFIEEGTFDVDVDMIKFKILEYSRVTGYMPVVVIDYLQVVRPLDVRMTEKQHIDSTVVELKRISRDLNTPIICVSSFNRASYGSSVAFESFKESGGIEYTADVVMGLQLRLSSGEDLHEVKNREPRPLDLVILKNRRGPAYKKIALDYWPKNNFFIES